MTTATQIAAEIARLSALLPAAVFGDGGDWDGDIAAVLNHLADAHRHQAQTLDHLSEMAENMDDAPEWEAVTSETSRTSHTLTATSTNLRTAAAAARKAQDAGDAQIAAARHLSVILAETRPSNVLAALGLVPAARFA